MADASNDNVNMRQQLYGIAECPICHETFKDPRALPCQHTYCLQCIMGFAANEGPCDKATCPLCRQEFTIPKNGVGELPKNFFVEQLKSVANLHPSSMLCEVCSETGSVTGKTAVRYCTDCRQRFCQPCVDSHRQIRATSSHRLVELGDGEIGLRRETSTEMATAAVINCEQHPGKSLDIYCFNCKQATCSLCFVASHHVNSHACCDVDSVAEEFRGHMTSDAEELSRKVERFRGLIAKLAEEKTELIARAGVVEGEVDRQVEQLKRMIDEERRMLQAELSSNVSSRLKQIETFVGDIELHVSLMENLIRRTEELGNNGTVLDIVYHHAGLHSRVGELVQHDFNETLDELGTVDLSFVVESLQSNQKFIGTITTKRCSGNDVMKSTASTWVCAVPTGDSVVGLTSLDERLFVLRDPSGSCLEVYDTETFALLRTLRVTALSNQTWRCGLASCSTNACLYVSDYDQNTVHVVDVASDSDDPGGSHWLVDDGPTGLSTNSARNVLVTCCNANKIQEYTTHGVLVREVRLRHKDVAEPIHVVQLNNGLYVVSHWNPEHGISVVDNDGRVVITHRNKSRSIFSFFSSPLDVLLNKPGHLAVTESGFVYLTEADTLNNRILVFDPSLGSTVELISTIDLDGPWSLFLDGSRDRLYMGECGGGRVILLNNLSKL